MSVEFFLIRSCIFTLKTEVLLFQNGKIFAESVSSGTTGIGSYSTLEQLLALLCFGLKGNVSSVIIRLVNLLIFQSEEEVQVY